MTHGLCFARRFLCSITSLTRLRFPSPSTQTPISIRASITSSPSARSEFRSVVRLGPPKQCVPFATPRQSRDGRAAITNHPNSPLVDITHTNSAMYNAHRGIAGAPAPPNNRLVELLEQVRAEFEAQGGRANEYEHQRESSPFVVTNTCRWLCKYRRDA